MTSIVIATYEGTPVPFDTAGWFDATAAARRFGKRPAVTQACPSPTPACQRVEAGRSEAGPLPGATGAPGGQK